MHKDFSKSDPAVARLSDDGVTAGQAYEFMMAANEMEGFHDKVNRLDLGGAYARVFNAFTLGELNEATKQAEIGASAALVIVTGTSINDTDFRRSAGIDGERFWNQFV